MAGVRAMTKSARQACMVILASAALVLAAASGHSGSPTAPPVAPGLALPVADAVLPGNDNGGARLQDTRITVLLWLAPGRYGIRRHSETADPVLCLPDGCYVSEGAERPARFLPGRRALGFANTWGERAGACRGSLACVFRDVDLGRLPGYLQPVDLHILRHDRRRGQVVRSDSACALGDGRLLCQSGLAHEDYAVWIVPEGLAAAAGSPALQRALAEGPGAAGVPDLPPPWRH
jgi:hypothetical protein